MSNDELIDAKVRIAELERKNAELSAQLVHNYHFADVALDKAGSNYMLGSGIIVSLAVLGGRKICEPFMIRDGFSAELIRALKADICRSYEETIRMRPKT